MAVEATVLDLKNLGLQLLPPVFFACVFGWIKTGSLTMNWRMFSVVTS